MIMLVIAAHPDHATLNCEENPIVINQGCSKANEITEA